MAIEKQKSVEESFPTTRLRLRSLPIELLKPAPYNPRLPLRPGDAGWEKLKRSLDEFDLVQPILWNEATGHVVGGHQRLEILKARGDTQVDCIVVHLSLEREKALNVTLNNREVGSDWDAGKLHSLLSELAEIPEFDVTLTGFDDVQLQELLFVPKGGEFPGLTRDTDEHDGHIRAILVVREEDWAQVQTALDELLAESPQVRLHVKQ